MKPTSIGYKVKIYLNLSRDDEPVGYARDLPTARAMHKGPWLVSSHEPITFVDLAPSLRLTPTSTTLHIVLAVRITRGVKVAPCFPW